MDKQEIKAAAMKAIEARRDELIQIGRDLYATPEPGFRETKTSAYMKAVLQKSGLVVKDGIALTGLKATARGRKQELNVGVCGELDSLLISAHSHANPATGAAHACGHHCQLTLLSGVMMGLVDTGLMNELDGSLTFLVVPAEEILELDYRGSLIEQGKIKYVGGKQEFIRLGEVDDVDCIICSHATTVPGAYFDFGKRYNGALSKQVKFIGRSAHSAKSPELGINALHAAVNAINNINALRETFRDDDHIRVHYIISKGGDSVNIIPDDVRIEMLVRGLTAQAMMAANRKVNAAIRAGAEAIGAQAKIIDFGAYLPFVQNEEMNLLFAANARELIGSENVFDQRQEITSSSTDAGDFATLKPTIHPVFGGASGVIHTKTFDIANEYNAYVLGAKAVAATVIDLLVDNARKGTAIKENFKPVFPGKQEYMGFFDDHLGK